MANGGRIPDRPPATWAVLRELVTANRILAQAGVLDAFGHVSVRHPEDANHYVIARSLCPEQVTERDFQRFTLAGEEVSGDTRRSYAETAIHGAIYEARPEVHAICHNHAPSVIPFGATRSSLRPIYHMGSLLGSDVPCWDIADEFGETDLLVRTLAQGRSLARALGPHRVALMRGHGSVVAGRDLYDVVFTAFYMEQNARLQLQAAALGPARYLSPGEIERAREMLLSPLANERFWNCWEHRVSLKARPGAGRPPGVRGRSRRSTPGRAD